MQNKNGMSASAPDTASIRTNRDTLLIEHRCAYCQKFLRPDTLEAQTEVQVSHGICRDCLACVMAGQGQSLADFLRKLKMPVIVLNTKGQPIFNNRKHSQQLADPGKLLTDLLASEVFACAYEVVPGGTNSICDCLSCTLHRTTAATYQSGIKHMHILASPDLDSLAGISNPCYAISTEMHQGTIHLTIEERKEFDCEMNFY